ncbi:MAG: hypothetical protein GEU91_16755 [Rhizobiales bacterium]|nr:hypothetical protein [Hyphomicrobiales bacterium]
MTIPARHLYCGDTGRWLAPPPSSKINRALAVVAGIVLLGSASVTRAEVPKKPVIEGPITGPGEMHPGMRFGPDGTNPDDFGYLAEEYFASGTAGPANTPYKVRVLVRRPAVRTVAMNRAKQANVVVYEPTHRGGNALIFQFARYGILQHGYIGMTVSARAINLVNPTTPTAGLKQFNPDRYGSLQVTDDQTNDILAQIAWMTKNRDRHSPLRGTVGKISMIMGGTSDSSGATRNYMANGHPTFRRPGGGPIIDGFFVSATLGTSPVEMTDVPTIQMPTQSELNSSNAWRRPDSDTPANRFRIYEVAGMSHNDSRDQPASVFPGCAEPLSRFPYGAMTFVGLNWVVKWAVFGTTPPHAHPVEVDAGPPRQLVLDNLGNVKGGVRTPHLDVPVYRYVIPNTGPGLCSQTGRQEKLSAQVLRSLYPTKWHYQAKFLLSLTALTVKGFWPKEYAKRYAIEDMLEFSYQ